MSKQTHTNPISRREAEALRGNPYVAGATTKTVRFTEEFKRLAYEGKQQGISLSETLRRCGIDPEVLGASRIEGCYVVPICQEGRAKHNTNITLDNPKEYQKEQTPALVTLLYVDWDNKWLSDTDRSMVRRER